jgi:hypothetical protein
MKWAGHVVRMGKVKKCYMVVIEKSQRKIPLGSPTRRREEYNGIDPKT